MIEKINEITEFLKTLESFSLFIGISRATYNKWLVDPDKIEVMEYINLYWYTFNKMIYWRTKRNISYVLTKGTR